MNPHPTTTAKLLALPSLREQAERDAEECHGALAAVTNQNDLPTQSPTLPAWDVLPPLYQDIRVDAQMALLSDLTRWQSQAWALREIGRLLRWDVGNRVPELSCLNHGAGPELCWAVTRSPINVSGNVAQFYDEWPYYTKPESRHKILGMSRITDRPAAIAAILLHLSESR